MGFGDKWRKWIASRLSSASILVLINGSPSKELKMELSLRQGLSLKTSMAMMGALTLLAAFLAVTVPGWILSKPLGPLKLLTPTLKALLFVKWRFTLRGRDNDDISLLIPYIGNTPLSPIGCDKWLWTYDPSGLFKVRSLSKIIQNLSLNVHRLGNHHLGNSWTHRKVNMGVCRASLNHLAMWVNLFQRGIHIASVRCPFCDSKDEDVNHFLISCYRVLPVWRKVWSWWNLHPPVFFSFFYVSDVASGNY
nr:hypothetical protein [Tanacetum cinerariifolium]